MESQKDYLMALNPTVNVLLEELRKEARRQVLAKEIRQEAYEIILANLACVELELRLK